MALLTKSEVKMARHWQSSFSTFLWAQMKLRYIKNAKKTKNKTKKKTRNRGHLTHPCILIFPTAGCCQLHDLRTDLNGLELPGHVWWCSWLSIHFYKHSIRHMKSGGLYSFLCIFCMTLWKYSILVIASLMLLSKKEEVKLQFTLISFHASTSPVRSHLKGVNIMSKHISVFWVMPSNIFR